MGLLRLIAPDKRHPTWRARGTYLGVRVDRSTGTRDRKVADRIRLKWQHEIESSSYAIPDAPSFASAAVSYMKTGGERRFLAPLLKAIGTTPLVKIDQALIDATAGAICPAGTPATRNRQIYTPVSAVLRHAGVSITLKRPKGGQGEARTCWLQPEDAFAIFAAARARHERLEAAIEVGERQFRGARAKAAAAAKRFAGLLVFLTYTGCRLNEALRLKPRDVDLSNSYCWCGKTKNGQPRGVHLPTALVVEMSGFAWGADRVFGVHSKGSRLYSWLDEVTADAGVTIPPGVAFHIFRHTFGSWMRRYGGLDTSGLVATGAWRSREAASVYEHVNVSDAARRTDMFPVEKNVEIREKTS